jgi:hypothetical protein
MNAMEQKRPVQQANPFRLIAKFFLFIVVKITVLSLAFWRRYPLPALMAVVVVIGSGFAVATGSVTMPWTPPPPPVPEARVSVEAYLAGQKAYNAELMWQSMDDNLKKILSARGRTLDSFKKLQGGMREAGVKVATQHVAGTELADGSKVFFYIITLSQGDNSQQVPQTFGVNKAGKITFIQPILEDIFDS